MGNRGVVTVGGVAFLVGYGVAHLTASWSDLVRRADAAERVARWATLRGDMVLLDTGKTVLPPVEPDETPEDERHVHPWVKGFWIDRTEVTVAAYAACVNAGECATDLVHLGFESDEASELAPMDACNWGKEGRGGHPMNCVSWLEAETYCAWAHKRLPTSLEWQFAARSRGQNNDYPWGLEAPGAQLCWHGNPLGFLGQGLTCPVSYMTADRTAQGVLGMAGNVSEWLAIEARRGAALGAGDSSVAGGNAWQSRASDFNTSASLDLSRDKRFAFVGFRCARSK